MAALVVWAPEQLASLVDKHPCLDMNTRLLVAVPLKALPLVAVHFDVVDRWLGRSIVDSLVQQVQTDYYKHAEKACTRRSVPEHVHRAEAQSRKANRQFAADRDIVGSFAAVDDAVASTVDDIEKLAGYPHLPHPKEYPVDPTVQHIVALLAAAVVVVAVLVALVELSAVTSASDVPVDSVALRYSTTGRNWTVTVVGSEQRLVVHLVSDK